jgi:probable HAF family extracellular repeat protein
MKIRLIRAACAVALCISLAACPFVPTNFTSFDAPQAVSTHVRGINNAGKTGVASVVGYYVDSAGKAHAFRRDSAATFVPINIPGETDAKAFDINNAGRVVGTVGDASGQHAFLVDGTTVTVPGNPPVPTGLGLNDTGLIIGTFSDSAGKQHGFTLLPGLAGPINVFNNLPTQTFGINNTRRMVGTLQEPSGEFHAFYLSGPDIASAQRIDIAGATRSDAFGINDAEEPAQIRHVGTVTIGGVDHGFVHSQEHGVSTFDFPGAKHTRAFGVNDLGEIVGEYVDTAGKTHGFIATF